MQAFNTLMNDFCMKLYTFVPVFTIANRRQNMCEEFILSVFQMAALVTRKALTYRKLPTNFGTTIGDLWDLYEISVAFRLLSS